MSDKGPVKFEQWITLELKDPEWYVLWCDAFRTQMREAVDPSKLGYFTRFICGICEKEEMLQGIRAYAHIYQEVCKAYGALKEDHTDGLEAEWERISRIARTMYALDEGLCEDAPLEPIIPELSQEETQRRLALLDAGRAKFGKTMVQAFQHIPLFADRNLLISWAAKCYYHVHGFQAPPRFDAAQATRDAMGQSDHFAELLKDVLAQCPQAKSR
jgi:hypothetical protein